MTDISTIARGLWKTIDDNSPTILTALSVTGTITTAVLAVTATFQAAEDIAFEEHKDATVGYQKLPLKGRALLVWQLYIPAVAVGVATIACTLGANTVSSRRAAALATAYSLTEKAFTEHKEKVVEIVGQNKATKINDAVAQDRIDKNPQEAGQVLVLGEGKVLCYDSLTDRYFNSTMERLKRAENVINKQILDEGYASQNELYDEMGLKRVSGGDEMGWTNDILIDLQITSTIEPESGKPALYIGYRDLPIAKHWRVNR